MSSEIDTTNIDHKKLAPIIEKLKNKVFNNNVVKDIFDKYDITKEELDLIPICFAHIPVSARTDHGIIYLNIELLKNRNFMDNDHYLAHELTHYAQQTTGSKPTQGSNDDNYLDNPTEQEGFRNQTKYISDTKGDIQAEDYIDKVLEHHDVTSDKEKDKKKEKLLEFASLFYGLSKPI